MKHSFNMTWVLVSVAIVANIIIFMFLSRNLENYVVATIVDENNTSHIK